MITELYDRNALRVEAVQVTDDNMLDVMRWCNGQLRENKATGTKFIRVKVLHPKDMKQTRAFVGNWILKSEMGFKIYSDSAFQSGYTKVED